MSHGEPAGKIVNEWIKRAQPHGALERLDGAVRLALPVGDSAARKPAKGGIGVEHQTPFDDARSGSMLAAKERNDVASYPKSLRVIFARLDRRSGQAQCFRDFCI